VFVNNVIPITLLVIIQTLYRKDFMKRVVILCLYILHATNQERKKDRVFSLIRYITTFYMRNHRKNLTIHFPESVQWLNFILVPIDYI